MPASSRGIRAGRAFVELFADDSKLVRGLRRAEKKIKAFGSSIRNMGLKMAGLGAAMLAPLLGAAKAFSSMGDQVAAKVNGHARGEVPIVGASLRECTGPHAACGVPVARFTISRSIE